MHETYEQLSSSNWVSLYINLGSKRRIKTTNMVSIGGNNIRKKAMLPCSVKW